MIDDEAIGDVLGEAARAVRDALEGINSANRARKGDRPGQYQLDLVADAAAVPVLRRAGMGVLSEESGLSDGDAALLAVIDPVDGSTNAAHGLPWYATSICVLDANGPRISLVVNQANGTTYSARRGGGAWRDGRRVSPSRCTSLAQAIVAVSGYPDTFPRWRQYRVLGASALDMCAVADGTVDGFWACPPDRLGPWDYLGASLVCSEAGAPVADSEGKDLAVRVPGERRSPVAGATQELFAELLGAVGGDGPARRSRSRRPSRPGREEGRRKPKSP